jgi:uncharacterized protein DUF4351
MQTYDAVLKSLLTSSDAFIQRLAHVTVTQWLNVELPRVQAPRVDLAGLREIGHIFKEESTAMPITESLLDHDLLGPVLKRGIEQGRQEGWQEGRQEGTQSGTHQGIETVLLRQMEKRFGTLPSWANTRLAALTTPELQDLSLRLLDVQTLDELLPR